MTPFAQDLDLAVRRYQARCDAADGRYDLAVVGTDAIRRLWSGYDLDLPALSRASSSAAHAGYAAVVTGAQPLQQVLMGTFAQGLLVGLFMADARALRERSQEATR